MSLNGVKEHAVNTVTQAVMTVFFSFAMSWNRVDELHPRKCVAIKS